MGEETGRREESCGSFALAAGGSGLTWADTWASSGSADGLLSAAPWHEGGWAVRASDRAQLGAQGPARKPLRLSGGVLGSEPWQRLSSSGTRTAVCTNCCPARCVPFPPYAAFPALAAGTCSLRKHAGGWPQGEGGPCALFLPLNL